MQKSAKFDWKKNFFSFYLILNWLTDLKFPIFGRNLHIFFRANMSKKFENLIFSQFWHFWVKMPNLTEKKTFLVFIQFEIGQRIWNPQFLSVIYIFFWSWNFINKKVEIWPQTRKPGLDTKKNVLGFDFYKNFKWSVGPNQLISWVSAFRNEICKNFKILPQTRSTRARFFF